jgi:hypothetical protein
MWYFTQKLRWVSVIVHGVTSQKTVIFIKLFRTYMIIFGLHDPVRV